MNEKQMENIVNKTIEDMKNIFPFKNYAQIKTKRMYISDQRIGILRYLFIKNFKEELEE